MNIDIFQILKLVFHLVEDTELKDNKTFQIVKEVVNSIDTQPSAAVNGEKRIVKGCSSEISGSENAISTFSSQISALSKPEAQR